MTKFLFILFAMLALLNHSIFSEQLVRTNLLLGDFSQSWDKSWKTKKLFKHANRFRVVEENGNKILSVHSATSASGMFREFRMDPIVPGTLSWRWKVKTSLSTNVKERTKEGDDYAARVFILFEPSFFQWRTPNVCYVWAGNEKAGSIFKSPHSKTVCTIVLQSGNGKAGQWIHEERDYAADYKKCFGKDPQQMSAIAVMVDTDDTEAETTAWFDDLILKSVR